MEIPFKKSKKGIIIEIKAEPRSSKAAIAGLVGNALKVKLTAPPAEGAANRQLIEVLSGELGVKKSSIKIIRGLTSRNKVVEIEGIEGL